MLVKPNLIHEYEMRAHWSASSYERRFHKWQRITKGEKYLRLAGNYVDREKVMENGNEKEIHGWIFEKLKIKKGCDSYFDHCNPTYTDYLHEKQKILKSRLVPSAAV